ncbi:hypothetical protein BH09SUM1_BH09SUM1_12340 [soil metagenome]
MGDYQFSFSEAQDKLVKTLMSAGGYNSSAELFYAALHALRTESVVDPGSRAQNRFSGVPDLKAYRPPVGLSVQQTDELVDDFFTELHRRDEEEFILEKKKERFLALLKESQDELDRGEELSLDEAFREIDAEIAQRRSVRLTEAG